MKMLSLSVSKLCPKMSIFELLNVYGKKREHHKRMFMLIIQSAALMV